MFASALQVLPVCVRAWMNLWFDNAGPLRLGTGFSLCTFLVFRCSVSRWGHSWTTWFTWNMPMTAALLARCLPVRRLNYPLRSRLTSNQHQYQYHYQGGVFAVGGG